MHNLVLQVMKQSLLLIPNLIPRVGAYTTSKMSLLTDNKERIVIKEQGGVEVKGTLGINVQYPGDDVDPQVAGAIRFKIKE